MKLQVLQDKDYLKKKCKYDDSYLQFGFTGIADSNKPDTQSVILSNFRKQFHSSCKTTTEFTYKTS